MMIDRLVIDIGSTILDECEFTNCITRLRCDYPKRYKKLKREKVDATLLSYYKECEAVKTNYFDFFESPTRTFEGLKDVAFDICDLLGKKTPSFFCDKGGDSCFAWFFVSALKTLIFYAAKFFDNEENNLCSFYDEITSEIGTYHYYDFYRIYKKNDEHIDQVEEIVLEFLGSEKIDKAAKQSKKAESKNLKKNIKDIKHRLISDLEREEEIEEAKTASIEKIACIDEAEKIAKTMNEEYKRWQSQ